MYSFPSNAAQLNRRSPPPYRELRKNRRECDILMCRNEVPDERCSRAARPTPFSRRLEVLVH